MDNVLIIGSGPAGLTAVIYTARASLAPLVIEGTQPGGQLTTTTDVENYPGFPEAVDGTALVMKMREQAERFGARFRQGDVVSADFSGKPPTVKLDDGETLSARTIIIASGARAKYLGIESERALIGRGVSGCATCDGALYRDVPVAVVGGGDTAMEDALFVTRFASSVTLIHRRNEFRASKIMADRVKSHPKIKILWDTVIDEVFDVSRNEVTGLKVRNLKTGAVEDLKVTGVFVAIGHEPNTAPFKGQVTMNPLGYIQTDNTRTNVEGVFAAGDVQDPVYRQAITAAGSGCMAALEVEKFLHEH